jgi:hypothetical protein
MPTTTSCPNLQKVSHISSYHPVIVRPYRIAMYSHLTRLIPTFIEAKALPPPPPRATNPHEGFDPAEDSIFEFGSSLTVKGVSLHSQFTFWRNGLIIQFMNRRWHSDCGG